MSSKSESSWPRIQAQESPAMRSHGKGPGMSTATQWRNVAFGERRREGEQQQEEMATFQ